MRDMKDRNSMESRQGQYSIKSEVDGTEVDGWMDGWIRRQSMMAEYERKGGREGQCDGLQRQIDQLYCSVYLNSHHPHILFHTLSTHIVYYSINLLKHNFNSNLN